MNKYLKGIKESDDAIMREIYQSNFPILKNFILNNRGDLDDAKDIFQDAIISLLKRLQKEDFEIKTTFGTYFFNVGKYIWFKRLKKKQLVEPFTIPDIPDVPEDFGEDALRRRIYETAFKKLGEDCQKVLNFFFDNKKFREISSLMNYTGEEYARRKKYLCTKYLTEKVKKDPFYKELNNR